MKDKDEKVRTMFQLVQIHSAKIFVFFTQYVT